LRAEGGGKDTGALDASVSSSAAVTSADAEAFLLMVDEAVILKSPATVTAEGTHNAALTFQNFCLTPRPPSPCTR